MPEGHARRAGVQGSVVTDPGLTPAACPGMTAEGSIGSARAERSADPESCGRCSASPSMTCAIVPGRSPARRVRRSALPRLLEVRGGLVPVHRVPPGGEVVRRACSGTSGSRRAPRRRRRASGRVAQSIIGVSWFAVLTMASFLSLPTTSHAQPEPKRPSRRPRSGAWSSRPCCRRRRRSRSSARRPAVSAPPGVISSQKKLWFQWPPTLLRTPVRTFSGTADRSASTVSSAWFRARTIARPEHWRC